jgi:hypothetical protein
VSASLRIRLWSAEELAHSRTSWNTLLQASAADPLFMSWEWQYLWWRHQAKPLEASLRLLGIYAPGDDLVGIAPFYAHEVRHRGIRLHRLELAGGNWRAGGGVFSEYLDVIAHRAYTESVLACVAEWLERNACWHDLALPCVRPESLARRLAREHLARRAYVREVDPIRCYRLLLPPRFDEYSRALDPHTRRRLLHQRGRLQAPRLERAAEEQVGGYLTELQDLGRLRWGSASEALHRFNLDFAAAQARAGRLRLSRLVSAGCTLSVMLDVLVDGVEYYLQSAFDPRLSRGISPGYLHFGYVIEDACREGLESLDLLAGYGQRRDYKRDLRADCSELVSCHVIRSPWLRALYEARGLLRRARESAA